MQKLLKNKNRIFIFVTIVLFSSVVCGQTFSINVEEWVDRSADENAVYMTKGPKWYNLDSIGKDKEDYHRDVSVGKFYRVHFLVYEVYYSLLIEEMSFSGVEGSNIKKEKAYFVSGFDISRNFPKMHSLTALTFVKWESWNTFVVDEDGTKLKFCIKPQGMLTVEKVN